MAENNLRALAFPKLDETQLASLERCLLTVIKRYRDGEKLFEAGQRDCNFYVVKYGGYVCARISQGHVNKRSDLMAKPVASCPIGAPARYDSFDKMLLNSVWRHGRSGQFSDDRDPYTR